LICSISACDSKPQEKWYVLSSPEAVVVAELSLDPGEKETIEILTDQITVVGFMTDISNELLKEYRARNIMPITVRYEPEKLTMHGSGGGQAVVPENGKIVLLVTNNSAEERLVDIFKRRSRMSQ